MLAACSLGRQRLPSSPRLRRSSFPSRPWRLTRSLSGVLAGSARCPQVELRHLSFLLCVSLLHRHNGESASLHLWAFGLSPGFTMPSADLCDAFPQPLGRSCALARHRRSPRVMHTHLHAYHRRIYIETIRVSIGLQRSWPPHLNLGASYAILVHRCNVLPEASFRLRLATDALAPG